MDETGELVYATLGPENDASYVPSTEAKERGGRFHVCLLHCPCSQQGG